MQRVNRLANKVFRSPLYPIALFCLSLLFLCLGEESFLVAFIILGNVIALALFVSEDLEPCLLPFLCIMILGTVMLFSLERVLPILPFGIPLVLGFFFHFIYYRKPFRPGRSFWGLLATSAAILLGGLFTIPPEEYFAPVTLYYTLGLSLGLLLVYYIYATEYKVKRDYSPISALMVTLFFAGLLLAAVVVWFFLTHFKWFEAESFGAIWENFMYRNTVANLMMICLPAGFYLAGYRVRSPFLQILLFLSGAVIAASMILTSSRTVMLFGPVLLLLCLILFLRGKSAPWVKGCCFGLLLLMVGALLLWQGETILAMLIRKLKDSGGLINPDEARAQMLFASFRDFLANPVFGVGLGSLRNAEIYAAEGCISWYHSYFPQIWGSMGLVGCAAFGYQLYQRVRLALFRPTGESVAVVLSCLGLFLYSQTDPGEFIPVPFAVLGVLLYVLLEYHAEAEGGRLN